MIVLVLAGISKLNKSLINVGNLSLLSLPVTPFQIFLSKLLMVAIDLIVTSPPYNLDIEYKSCNDAQPYEEYLKFTENWLKRCLRWLKSDGRMCLNIPLDKQFMDGILYLIV